MTRARAVRPIDDLVSPHEPKLDLVLLIVAACATALAVLNVPLAVVAAWMILFAWLTR